jgi:two-component system, OmpR family, sensor histidine kinase BaeS
VSGRTRVPWRRSLLVRLVVVGALIAVVAVAAATFATVRATTVAVREEQQDSLHADAVIYDELVGYAATHRGWAGAEQLVAKLARDADRQVTVTDETGRVLVDSDGDDAPRAPGDARARLDPLDVDPVLLRGAGDDEDADELAAVPRPCTGARCDLRPIAATGLVDDRVPDRVPAQVTEPAEMFDVGPATRAWRQLVREVDACLERADLPPARGVTESFAILGPAAYAARSGAVAACATEARRGWYDGRVAPPALLLVSGDEGGADVLWDLSGPSQTRIVLLAGGVLLLTVLLCVLLASSVVRPLRRMAAVAHEAGEGDLTARVREGRHDEVGEVARAFNRMAGRRQQLEEARRRLVSDVSHELRTPLSNVRGWVEAAQDGLVEPDERLLASLHEETLHLQRLVEDLHDLALGDAGELRLEPMEIEVGVFLDQVAASFRAAADLVGVALLVEADPELRVDADPVRLRQAVANLVANALRHTPDGGTVTLRGGGGGWLEVADTGAGIPAEELPHVFERFRRADAARSRATGGSGLGLAIVRQIVEAHGGSATIASTLGKGTTVRLMLP